MYIKDLIKFAEDKGINTYDKNITEIIREIQIREGNSPCFGTNTSCKYRKNCLWADHCQIHGHKMEIK
jgi:hypothetical protein